MTRHTIPLGNGRREYFDLPDRTEVADVAGLRPQLDQGSAFAASSERRLRAARQKREAFDKDSRREVREAAKAGKTSPSKKLVKRLRALDDELAEAEYEYEGATALMHDLRAKAVAALVRNAPALRAEAVDRLDSDILKLATVHAKLREIQAGFDEHAGTLGLIEQLRTRGRPSMIRPRVGESAYRAIDAAVNALAEAVAHATNLMEHGKTAPLPAADEADESDTTAADAVAPEEGDEETGAEAPELEELDEDDLEEDDDE